MDNQIATNKIAVFIMSAILLPPAYSEAPSEDLAAQLEQMKVMMEQMRQEKERTDAIIRAKQEEEVQKKKEEQLQKEQEDARQLVEFFKPRQARVHHYAYNPNPGSYHGFVGLFREMDKSGENLVEILSNGQFIDFLQQAHDIMITDRHIYRVIGKGGYHLGGAFETKYLSRVYTFNNPLTLSQVKMIDNTLKDDSFGFSLMTRISNRIRVETGGIIFDMDARRKFESIIRLIPGSYKNGDWRQLDGFFGMYFNETTMEVSELPPPSL